MRKKLFMILAILLSLPSMVFAKEISLKEFNFTDGGEEYNEAVTETLDGGYIVASSSDWYPVLVKYDKNDKIEWKKYDDTYSYFYDIDIDTKGNIYVAGSTYGDETVEFYNEVAFVSKYDEKGNLLKTVLLGEDQDDAAFYDLEVDDEKIVAVGYLCEEYEQYSPTITGDDRDYCGAYSVILDKDLTVKKEALFDYNSYESFYGTTLTKDGGYLAVGFTVSDNIPGVEMGYIDSAPIAIKYDKDGKQEWIYDLPYDERLDYSNSCYYNYRGGFYDVIETCDGNFAIVGSYSELTMMEEIELSYGWKQFDEMLGESYNGLEIDYDSDNYKFYESQAAVLSIVDKTGKEVNKYIENDYYDDVYTDILLLDNCSFMVTGFTGDEYNENSGRPHSLRANEESLGWNSNTCIADQSNAALRIFDNDLKVEWEKDYVGSSDETLINIAPVGEHEFVAVGWMDSEDLPEVELSEYADGLIVRVKVTYEITKNPTENGSFDAANEHGKADVVAKGDTGIITTVPEEGYKVNSVKVVDSKGEEVPVTKVENGKYTYPIHDDTWVTVTFAKIEVAENPKTGVEDFLLVGLGVVTVCAGAYYVAQKNNVFKKM